MDDLLPEFLAETNDALAELDLALVRLERAPGDQATLSLIFRLVHTIKGTCGFLGLPRLERVAHAGESVLGHLRDGALAASPTIITLVLAASDRMRAIVAGLGATGAEPEGDDAALIAALDRAASGTADAAACTAPPEPQPGPETAPAEPARQTIRVPVSVLEELMTLVSELVLTRNQLVQLARTDAAASRAGSVYGGPLARLSQITADLQDSVMRTRMQPIGAAWTALPRLVRDLAQETGKTILLDLHGQDTELDRQMLELMRDPLTHMVRNSADHGLETPAERRAAGKPEAGRITLSARHESGQVIIAIGDDGRGIDLARVRAKALAQGLATEAELAGMGPAQIHAFIFRAGFSTAAALTAISGRGVGMDVVRANIERIGGSIELASTPGAGSCFTVKIPLTLAIVPAVIVQAGQARFAIPQSAVRELVRVEHTAGPRPAMEIEHVGGAAVLRLRDRMLPLVRLSALLRLEDAAAAWPLAPTIVVATIGAASLGIVVDAVFDTEEIVVKPVAPVLRHVTMFSGNTILGDGSVIMILDPAAVARSAGIEPRLAAAPDPIAPDPLAVPPPGAAAPLALLVFQADAAGVPHAVPLDLVARLEMLDAARIEATGAGLVTQYRGQLMRLVSMAGDAPPKPSQPVLVFTDGPRVMGLMVERIVDVVHERLQIGLGSARPGVLGTAVVAGQATDVLDTGHFLALACQDWFAPATQARKRVLVVEDNAFFRQLLIPALSAAGFDVTAAGDAAAALALRDGGLAVCAIVSDIEMPGMDGLAFARAVRQGGAWAETPLFALSARDGPDEGRRAQEAGFSAHLPKSRHTELIGKLTASLLRHPAADGAWR